MHVLFVERKSAEAQHFARAEQGRMQMTGEREREGFSCTLYQCFFTLPSVRAGKVLAISLQLLPASLSAFNLCSSAGVHGVFVRPFFATGLGS